MAEYDEFPSLILDSGKIQRRTLRGIYEYRFAPRLLKNGFYIFRIAPRLDSIAEWVRETTPEERDEFMKEVPVVGAITSMWNQDAGLWFCHPLNDNQVDRHPNLHFPAPLLLPTEELSVLQPIQAWIMRNHNRQMLVFKDLNMRYPTETLDRFREYLGKNPTAHDVATTMGIGVKATPEERKAFTFTLESNKPPIERLITESLKFVGAKLIDYADVGNGQYKVNYEFKGERESVTVNQRMTCVDAGICLINKRGEHYKGHVEYDLASIVLVKWRGEHRHEEDDEDE